MQRVEPVANYHCKVGENPLWDSREQRLYWTDIETGRMFRFEPTTGAHDCFYQSSDMIGGFTLQDDGTLLLFRTSEIGVLDAQGNYRAVARPDDAGRTRFNDVIADPEGRVFAGTIGKTDESGGLFRVEHDGRLELVWRGTGCANGMGFTPDLRSFYWTDSTNRRIYIADYEGESGALSNRREFYAAPGGEGTPDGMTVDCSGRIWTARWGGSAVLCLSPEASVVDRIELPVSRVSSATFGGPQLDVLFVTTAGASMDDGAADGTLYSVKMTVPGTPAHRSRILI